MNNLYSFIPLSSIINFINSPNEAHRLEGVIDKIKEKMERIEHFPGSRLTRIFMQIEFDCMEMTGRSGPKSRMNKKSGSLSLYIILTRNDIAKLRNQNDLENFIQESMASSLRSISNKYANYSEAINTCVVLLEKLKFIQD